MLILSLSAGIFWREILSEQDKKKLVNNVVGAMKGITGPKKEGIINRQLCHFFRADIGLGMLIAQGLGLDTNALTSFHGNGTKKVETVQ